jgi:predicted nucleic acid-binding protein
VPILFDSSLYINALRGDGALLLERWARKTPLWMSAVVLEELYAGARTEDHRTLGRLARDFERAGRTLTPSLSDWANAGKMLASLAQRYGYEQMGRSRLTNDALIAASAARMGIVVLTANQRDFAQLAEFCPLQWQVPTKSSGA